MVQTGMCDVAAEAYGRRFADEALPKRYWRSGR